MSKKIIGFDIGSYTIKTSVWNESTNEAIPSDASLVKNDTFGYMSNVSVSVKSGNYSVCDHAKSPSRTNLSSYIWNIKGNVGDHQKIKDLKQEISEFKQRKSLKHDDKRAYYNLKVNGEEVSVDAEVALSLMLEYLFYLGFKESDDMYDNVSSIAQRGVEQCERAIISIPSYYTEANIRGMQVAMDAKSLGVASFVRDYTATCMSYGYHRNLNHEFDAQPTKVLFVQMGHSYTSCTLAEFSKDYIDVKSHDYSMIGGIDFTAALYKEIRDYYFDHCEITEYSTLNASRQEMMEKQFWECAERAKNDFALEGTDMVDVEIDDLFAKDLDTTINFEITRQRVCEIWKDLFEQYELFVDGFIRDHSSESIQSCEILGGSMRLPDLKNRLNTILKTIGIDRYSNTLNMDSCVAHGLAILGQGVIMDKKMLVNEREVSLEYTINDHTVYQAPSVLGIGYCSPVEGQLCLSNSFVDELKEGVDHDWSAILTHYQEQDFLRPSICETPSDMVDELPAEISDSSSIASIDVYKDDWTPSRTSILRSSIFGSKRYSSVPQDDTIVLEISGMYSLRSTFHSQRNSIVNSQTGKSYGYANTEFNQLNGEYCLYYDEDLTILKEKCTYLEGERHGVHTMYYNDAKNSVHYTCEYVKGKRVNHYISYYPNGQLECIVFYDEGGVERRRVEFFDNGFIKRASERDSEDVTRWKMLEFSKDLLWICAVFGTRDQKEGKYVYARAGEGYLFGGNRYVIQGEFKGDSVHVDCEHGFEKFNVLECISVLKKDSNKESYYLKNRNYPWKKLDRQKDANKNTVLHLFKKEIKLYECVVLQKGKHFVQTIRSILGYPLYTLEESKKGTVRTEYYPMLTEEEYNMGLFKMNVVMKGVYDKPVIAKVVEMDRKKKVVKEEQFLNNGEKM